MKEVVLINDGNQKYYADYLSRIINDLISLKLEHNDKSDDCNQN